MPDVKYDRSRVYLLTEEQYNQLILIVRDTILELDAMINSECEVEKEAVDEIEKIYNVLTNNDKNDLLKNLRKLGY